MKTQAIIITAILSLSAPWGHGSLVVYEGFDIGVGMDTAVAGTGLSGASSVGFAGGSSWNAVASANATAQFTAAGLNMTNLASTGGALRLTTESSAAGVGVNAYRPSGVNVADGTTAFGSFLFSPQSTQGRFAGLVGVETGYTTSFNGTLTYPAHRLGDNDDPFLFTVQPDSFNSANQNYTAFLKVRRYLNGSFASATANTTAVAYTAGQIYLGIWKITNLSGYPTDQAGTSTDPSLTAQSAAFWTLSEAQYLAILAGGITESELDSNSLVKVATTQDAFRAHLLATDFLNLAALSGGAGGVQSILLDEIRIGTSLADVTPVPEPATLALLAGVLGLLVALRGRWRA